MLYLSEFNKKEAGIAYLDDVSFFLEEASTFLFSLGFELLEGVLDDLLA